MTSEKLGFPSTSVDFSGALLPVNRTDMGQELLVPSSGSDLLTPSPASGSAGFSWLAGNGVLAFKMPQT